MDAILKFKEAAKELQSDPKYLVLAAARTANDGDEQLQSKIGEFNLRRMDLNNEMEKDDQDENRVTQLNEEVNGLYGEIMQNENMLAYTDAKQGIEGFLSHVNAILNAAIDGEDPMLVEEPSDHEGCEQGGCSSCAGCG